MLVLGAIFSAMETAQTQLAQGLAARTSLEMGAEARHGEENKVRDRMSVLGTLPLPGHTGNVMSVAWNRTGTILASGSEDRSARIWEIQDETLKHATIVNHKGPVNRVAWSPLSDCILATASSDCTVGIWDIRRRQCIASIPTKGKNTCLAWSPDATRIAIGNKSNVVSVIDTVTWTVLNNWGFKTAILDMQWGPKSDHLLLCTGKGQVQIMTYPAFKTALLIDAHGGPCTCMQFNKNHTLFATGGADSELIVWETESMSPCYHLQWQEAPLKHVSFSHDGKLIASASGGSNVSVYLVQHGSIGHTIQTGGTVNAVAWHPEQTLLAIATAGSAPNHVNLSIFGILNNK